MGTDMGPDLATVRGAASARSSLAELYERHIGPAEALAFLLTRDRAAAEDLAQEAFVKLAGRLRHLRNPEAFGAYLRRTVVNLCRAHFRRLRFERDYLRRQPLPSSVAVAEEPRDEVARALATLPYRQRAAIVLRYYEDLSEEQTAEAMETSPRAVNSLVSRGMAALRDELGGIER
jgi:RNA polymerase sigma-70 factor (sigma-E family)